MGLFAGLLAGALPARAVIIAASSNVTYNSTAPAGSLTNSGWQWVGYWGPYTGHPIAPRYFITAAHFGGETNWTFYHRGLAYHPTAGFRDPASDLMIWRVAETFPTYAPIYTGTNETGADIVVFGRGTQRGAAITLGGQFKGWQWGFSDTVLRWGQNRVSGTFDAGAPYGQLLFANFDRVAGSNECHLSVGDSGGSLYLQNAGQWQLAGIHLSVDGPFTNAAYPGPIQAALYDAGGFWVDTGAGYIFVTDGAADVPTSFYSTRISSRKTWINSVIDFLPGVDLRLTGIDCEDTNTVIRLATGTGKQYRVEHADHPTAAVWTALTNRITGNGQIQSVIHPGGCAGTSRYYRVGLLP